MKIYANLHVRRAGQSKELSIPDFCFNIFQPNLDAIVLNGFALVIVHYLIISEFGFRSFRGGNSKATGCASLFD